MRRIQSPQFASDLYRDLRDRRLIIPIAALLVALIAVPVALSSSQEQPAPPPAPSAVATDGATRVQAAVLAESSGIRNYRQRLEALKSKNPFKQQFAAPSPSQVGIEEAAEVSIGTQSTPTGSATPAGVAALPDSEPSSGDGDGNVSVSDPAPGVSTEPQTITKPVKPEIRFYSGRVDVTVGPLGRAKKVKGVRALDMLPSKRSPVVAFIGLGEGADRAIFVLSRDVTMSDGDGKCGGGSGGTCQFVELAPGDQRFMHLADGSAYRLRVLDTDVVRVPDPRK